MCAGRFGLGWVHDVFTIACHMFMHTYLQVSIFLYILSCWCFSDCLSLSPSISLSCVSCFMAPKHKSTPSQNSLRSGASSPLILHRLLFSSMMREPVRTSRRTSLNEAFIQNAKSFCLISLILHFPLSSTVGVESHFMAPQSLVHPWSFRSSTLTCMGLIL